MNDSLKILNVITWIIFVLCLLIDNIYSQKGATPISPKSQLPTANCQLKTSTYAVVVGISDYQDKDIPDLKYADRDALAFVDWMKSPGGGSVQDDNIKLLTNQKATRAQFGAALDWLIDNCKTGDQAIIYFSGHGDIETKTKYNRGYLLCYDSPPNNYAAGAFHLTDLQDVVNTLSDDKVKTLIIADACHSGKLAGSSVGGSQATAQSLANQFANEIKILSCQPNEYSMEGEQWGGGRGVFSYFLVQGLYGYADQNSDGIISLMELNNYLEEHVSKEVNPMKQIPVVIGDKYESIAKVDLNALAMLEKKAYSDSRILAYQDVRGIEEVTLMKVDEATRSQYNAFKAALKSKNFFFNKDSQNIICADLLFDHLNSIQDLKALHAAMRRNYAATLQDVVQQALNALLADDPYEYNNWLFNPNKYSEYPKYLARAIELMGKDHYSYPLLYSQQKYFEAYLLFKIKLAAEEDAGKRDSLRLKAKSLLLEAIAYAPDAAYVYHALGILYRNQHDISKDSLEIYCNKAIELAPDWLIPYNDLADDFLNAKVQPSRAEEIIRNALVHKPNSYMMNLLLSWVMQKHHRYKEADSICLKLIQAKPNLFNAWGTLTQTHGEMRDWDNVFKYAKHALEIEPNAHNWAWFWYFKALISTKRVNEAIELNNKDQSLRTASVNVNDIYYELGEYYFLNKKFDKALDYAKQVMESQVSSMDFIANSYVLAGKIALYNGNYTKAQQLLEKGINIDPAPQIAAILGRSWLGELENRKGNYQKADSLFKSALHFPVTIFYGYDIADAMYGDFLLQQSRDSEAIIFYNKAIDWMPLGYEGYYGLAKYYSKHGDQKIALDFLEKSLDRYYPVSDPILQEPLFEKIRMTKRFKDLMKKHFGGNEKLKMNNE